MRRSVLPIACLLALAAAAATAPAEDLFTENASEAIAQAAKEGKDLYFHFTGSDWCIWCKKLDAEVYSQKPFIETAPTHFVLVKLDFPRQRKMPDEVKKQNQLWMKKFHVTGFPTIYLTDAKAQRPYAKTGYRRGGAEKYVEHLDELRQIREKRDAALAKAQGAAGAAKAKFLDEALAPMDEAIVLGFYQDEVKEIIRLDADGKAGLKAKYEAMLATHQLNQDVMAKLRKRDTAGAVKAIDEGLAKLKLTGEPAQQMLFFKARVLFSSDRAAAKVALEQALAAAPEGKGAAQIKAVLDKYFSEPKPEK